MTMEELLTRICASKPEEASADHDCCAINNITETEEPTQHCLFFATFRFFYFYITSRLRARTAVGGCKIPYIASNAT